MAYTFARATTATHAKAIAAFVSAEGYDLAKWDGWSAASLTQKVKLSHVHIWMARESGVLKGFIHWVVGQTDEGPAGWFVGCVTAHSLGNRLELLDRLALRFGDHFGRLGRWFSQAEKEDLEAITYARMVAPLEELDAGQRYHWEGDFAATCAVIQARLTP